MATRINTFKVDTDDIKILVTGVARVDEVEYTDDGAVKTPVIDNSGEQRVDQYGQLVWKQKTETVDGREIPLWKLDVLMKYKDQGVTYSDTYGIKVPYPGNAEELEDREVRFQNLRVGQFRENFTFKAQAVGLAQSVARPSAKPDTKPTA
ncbi:hypothetical protein GCM10009551_079880 [Nocardiopsis tropica]|uniref:hypothetical protein n=1 Tax=Tsukamurella strandjordii TaxID=147577 RepID=UPI0031DAD892